MPWIKIGAGLMFFAVAFGAFGGHALKAKLDAYSLDVFKTANFYHFVHALALFFVAWFSQISNDPKINTAGIFILAGVVIFSGSLYALAITGQKTLGAITPIGGLSFLIGWGLIVFSKL